MLRGMTALRSVDPKRFIRRDDGPLLKCDEKLKFLSSLYQVIFPPVEKFNDKAKSYCWMAKVVSDKMNKKI